MKGDADDPLNASDLQMLVHCTWSAAAPKGPEQAPAQPLSLPPRMPTMSVPKQPKQKRRRLKGPKRRKYKR